MRVLGWVLPEARLVTSSTGPGRRVRSLVLGEKT